jgi:hypothetical protein
MTGQLRPGKTHDLRPNVNSTTLCGLTVAKVPGNLLKDDSGEVNCQVCIRVATRQQRWAAPPVDLSFYCCGKISKNDWRHPLTGYALRDTNYPLLAYRRGEVPIIRDGLGRGLHYAGPYFIGCDHGCSHGHHTHGASANMEFICDENFDFNEDTKPFHAGTFSIDENEEHSSIGKYATEVAKNCLTSIAHASVVFAWIDDLTAYGSIAELGFAHALKIPIWLAGPKPLPDLWFIQEMASVVVIAETAGVAFRELLRTQKGLISA